MKLKDCTHGKLVITENGRIGMIVGITNNYPSADREIRSEKHRAIPLVQWAHGESCGIHYDHIEPFKEF